MMKRIVRVGSFSR